MRGRDKEYLKDTLLDGELVIENDENKVGSLPIAFLFLVIHRYSFALHDRNLGVS